MRRRRVSWTTVRQATMLVTAAAMGLALAAAGPVAAQPASSGAVFKASASAQYEVYDARNVTMRNAIASTGAAIDNVEHAIVSVTATPAEVKAIRALGFRV